MDKLFDLYSFGDFYSFFYYIFYRRKEKKHASFIDFSLFKNKPYTAAVFSNFLLNAVAGTLLIANVYVQKAREFSSFEAGMLTVGYLIIILSTIRVGEKLLQKLGPRKPMILGATITGVGIAVMTFTFLSDTSYSVVVFVGYILFGLGLGFYATPSTDTAISNAPTDKLGAASGIYKMASSLGGALGVAISGTIYDNISIVQDNATHMEALLHASEGASVALLVNVLFCVLSIIAIATLIPKSKDGKRS